MNKGYIKSMVMGRLIVWDMYLDKDPSCEEMMDKLDELTDQCEDSLDDERKFLLKVAEELEDLREFTAYPHEQVNKMVKKLKEISQ